MQANLVLGCAGTHAGVGLHQATAVHRIGTLGAAACASSGPQRRAGEVYYVANDSEVGDGFPGTVERIDVRFRRGVGAAAERTIRNRSQCFMATPDINCAAGTSLGVSTKQVHMTTRSSLAGLGATVLA